MTANRWVVLCVLFLARTALGYSYQSVASVSPLLVDDLALSFAEIGALIGFFGLPGMFVALPGGLLGKRFGDVKVAVGGLALMALGGFVMALATEYGLASVGRLFMGIGAVTMTVVLVKLVDNAALDHAAKHPERMAIVYAAPVLIGTICVALLMIADRGAILFRRRRAA